MWVSHVSTDETDNIFCSVSNTFPNDAQDSVTFSATRTFS